MVAWLRNIGGHRWLYALYNLYDLLATTERQDGRLNSIDFLYSDNTNVGIVIKKVQDLFISPPFPN
jgi:hypothetical protein